MSTKTNPGRFFEDYRVGEVIRHAVPRTIAEGERALEEGIFLEPLISDASTINCCQFSTSHQLFVCGTSRE